MDIFQTLITQQKIFIEDKNQIGIPIGNPRTEFVGCYDEDFLYLNPPAVWNAVLRFCRAEGSHFPITKHTLYRLLRIKEFIKTNDGQNTITIWFKGKSMKVLQIYKDKIFPEACDLDAKGGDL